MRYEGTKARADDAAEGIEPVHREELYLKGDGPYHVACADRLKGAAALPGAEIFNAGESQAQPRDMPTIPRNEMR